MEFIVCYQPFQLQSEVGKDVYKRQHPLLLRELQPQGAGRQVFHQLGGQLVGHEPVSYTHLDVYKRQLYYTGVEFPAPDMGVQFLHGGDRRDLDGTVVKVRDCLLYTPRCV